MNASISRILLMVLVGGPVGGCALGTAMEGADPPVTVVVHNPSDAPAWVRFCAPAGCAAEREVPGRDVAEFRFSPRGGTRAVVTAKRGDLVVEQRPIDFRPGERYRVVLDIP